ncbi:MAG: DUF5060 domain-containing protein [Opitutaceae bacterium]|nr:DUF5060 domain-containing protein [Opitutaceae bacterium]
MTSPQRAFLFAGLSATTLVCFAASPAAVPQFAPHEVAFEAAGNYGNPYVECAADATLTEPDGRTTRALPLFWDGGRKWVLRFSPDQPGVWKWSVRSADRGLDGRTGSFNCVTSDRHGSLQRMRGAPRHFEYQNGRPVWFLGDTQWSLVTDNREEKHDRAAIERFLRNRAAQGFNVVHFMMLNEAGWPNNGGPPWTDIGGEKLNPAYFQEVDARVAFANQQGFVLGVTLAWGNKSRKEPWSWGRIPNLPARLRYARYIAARYGAYDVYFIVSGEWHGEVRSRPAEAADVRREFVQIGDALQAADPHRRMIGIHPMTAHGSTREFNDAARWMDFADYQQNYSELHERALASRTVAKPVVNSEYGYYLRDQNGDGVVDKNHSYTVDDIRHASWDIVMAGAYLVTGFGSTYMGGHRHPTPFLADDPKNAIWAEQLGRVRTFFEQFEYWKLAPHDELLRCAVPRGAERKGRSDATGKGAATLRAPETTYWCLADPGRTYLVYVRGTKEPVILQTTGVTGVTIRRFDPRSGQSSVAAANSQSGGIRLTAPDEHDWVFAIGPASR